MAKGKPQGMVINGNYIVTLADGTRGTIIKIGCRHRFKIDPAKVKLTPMEKGKGKAKYA